MSARDLPPVDPSVAGDAESGEPCELHAKCRGLPLEIHTARVSGLTQEVQAFVGTARRAQRRSYGVAAVDGAPEYAALEDHA